MATRAAVFAGQGAQAVGMGRDLAEAYPACRELFEKADEVLGYGLSQICFGGPDEELTKSSNCQPAIFVASMACYRALQLEAGDPPFAGAAGLSLGEWSALHMAGALSFEDTLRVLEARGRFMQEACEEREGGMVSIIGLSGEQLDGICARTGVEVANINSAQQTVLSGERKAVESAEALANEEGAKRTVVLNVAGAFHSSLMLSAGRRLDDFLAGVEFAAPAIPVVANATGAPHGGPADIRRDMVAQVSGTVQWRSCVEWLKGRGVDGYVECGPGKVLCGLIKRIDKGADLRNIADVDTLMATAEALRT